MRLWRLGQLSLIAGLLIFSLAGCDEQTPFTGGPLAVTIREDIAPPPEKRIAVSHFFALRLPNADVETLQQRHLDECAKLKCLVVETSIDRDDFISANIQVRLAPDAFENFIKIISSTPATITSHRETREDKAVEFRDAEKRLEVKTTLRQRLLDMLKDPSRKSAADLASIEKELAQVQGDIEQAVAERDYLKTITETVKVSIEYRGITAQAGGFDLTPLERAITNAGKTLISSLAAFISFIVAVLPWVPFAALVLWAGRRGYRRWKGQETP